MNFRNDNPRARAGAITQLPPVASFDAPNANLSASVVDGLERETRAAERALRLAARRQHVDHIAEVALAGTIGGAAVGTLGGPAAAIIGAVFGGVAGALAAGAMDSQSERERVRTAELDETIGVTGGDLGAASPSQPPSRRGFVSAASAGISGGGGGGRGGDGPIGPSSD